MTHRQELFIQEYIKTGNATNSAIKAGYSKKDSKSYRAGKPYKTLHKKEN